MLSPDELSARDTCVYIKKNENALDKNAKRKLIQSALNKAEDCSDYIEIACVISHRDSIDDKKWAREIFEKASELAEDSTDFFELAKNIAFKDLLNDKEWGRRLFEESLQIEINENVRLIDGYCDIASEVADSDGINDKQWAREIFEMILSKDFINNNDRIEVAQLIAEDSILGDKDWALKLINEAARNIEYGDDYLQIAFCLSHTTKLNNKTEGRKWFQKAVKQNSQYNYSDYFDIAKLIANEQVLNDKEWAIELCMKTIEQTEDSDYLLDIACFVEGLDKQKSSTMFAAALEKAETSMQFLNIACNISASEKLNDKSWGKQIFEKALSMDNSDEERNLIEECMSKYL